jgi:membrane protein YqaA with SNARE-associated domain
LPGGSEAILLTVLADPEVSVSLAIIAAAAGNILGSVINWALGRSVDAIRGRSWFPISAATFARYRAFYLRWGIHSLWFCWAPIIGDPLTAMAGVMGAPIGRFLVIVAIAKTLRYVVVAGLARAFF